MKINFQTTFCFAKSAPKRGERKRFASNAKHYCESYNYNNERIPPE